MFILMFISLFKFFQACHIRVTSIQPHANLHQADIVRQKRNSIAADRTGGDGPW